MPSEKYSFRSRGGCNAMVLRKLSAPSRPGEQLRWMRGRVMMPIKARKQQKQWSIPRGGG
ncbi:hypothetical protein OOU_Y34scaffold00592g8 [Pyricularia oryzae Y34]|uniref:Uncharacterized protein n=2 Tax=Pyricularia oryzae TaxID=318829 RepID=A0AA97NVZ8_PYRO3|nr:hypothetical protein OOU_Y34scaffold00592g8 [Pyricularia oryzae Y34]